MSFDPCNGYERFCCDKCVFYCEYENHLVLLCGCLFNPKADSYLGFHQMKWVSASDYDKFPDIRAKHDEPCPCFISYDLMVDTLRKQLADQAKKKEP